MTKHVASGARAGRFLRSVALVALLAMALVAGWYALTRGGVGDRCPTTLTVVTASSFAPVLGAAGRSLRDGRDCVQVDVKISDGRAAAGEVMQSAADAWIPDDGAWTATVLGAALAPNGSTGAGTVLATSPIYLVTDPATAERVRAAGGTWLGLAKLINSPGGGLRLAVRDPSGSGDGMVAAGAVGEAVWLTDGMDSSSLALAGAVKASRTVTHELAATPTAPGEVGLVPEYALLPGLTAADAGRVYLAPSDHTAQLRFTWLPTATAVGDARKAVALRRLLAAFGRPDAVKALAAAGLRGPGNTRPVAPGSGQLPDVTAPPFDVLDPHHVHHVFAAWDPEDRRSNLLIVVDVGTAVPGRSRVPPIDLLRLGCRSVADLLPDGSRLGLWEVGATGYRKVVVTGRLDADLRTTLGRAVGGLTTHRPAPTLYDAVVDAYAAVRDDYQTDMINQVLVFTDDQNGDSANAAAVQQLASRLLALRDVERPVRLSVVVLGSQDAADRLKNALKPVDAYVGTATDAPDIQADFIHVVAGGLHE